MLKGELFAALRNDENTLQVRISLLFKVVSGVNGR